MFGFASGGLARPTANRPCMNEYTLDAEMLATLLREAESAHADYERSLGHADADWPAWYASFIVDELDRRRGTEVGGG
jgi:hypothetical protein